MDEYVQYIPNNEFINKSDVDNLYQSLHNEIIWRKTSSQGDNGVSYRYSGSTKIPVPWTPTILSIKAEVERVTGETYNFVLCNLYPNGNASIGWHSDNERDIDPSSSIASFSIGASRDFKVRSKDRGEDIYPRAWITNGHEDRMSV